MEHAASYGTKICKQIQALNITHSDTPAGVITVSVGVTALIPDSSNSIHQLIEEADKALHFSKSMGRNQVATFAQLKDELKCS
jgi:diguanylate cyclase (GGDEF)-like protein